MSDLQSGDLQSRFEAAVAGSKTLEQRPENSVLLKLYALYKQATEGDVAGRRPGFTDMVGRAKFDAWATLKGTASETAKERYIALVESLRA